MNKAGIDLGTNTIRLLIIDENGNDIVRKMLIVRLGENIDKTHKFTNEALNRTLTAVKKYLILLKKYNVPIHNINFFATSAARDAKNKNELINGIEKILNIKPKIISGNLEAKLSFLGAISNLNSICNSNHITNINTDFVNYVNLSKKSLVFDIGGGSTEFGLGKKKLEKTKSLNIGSVRITEKFFNSIPPSLSSIKVAKKFIDFELKKIQSFLDESENIIGVAGTVTTITMYKNNQTKYDFNRTNGYQDTVKNFIKITEKMLTENMSVLQKYMPHKRADVIQGGALIFLEILKKIDPKKTIIVSEKDILDSITKL
jgi:exopolyphosphatase/guanosine-5'-triphosphate,3'-diphosphate pyrophosphatase